MKYKIELTEKELNDLLNSLDYMLSKLKNINTDHYCKAFNIRDRLFRLTSK